MVSNFLELVTTLKYLKAKWLPEKMLILRPELKNNLKGLSKIQKNGVFLFEIYFFHFRDIDVLDQ